MDRQNLQLAGGHKATVERLVAACQADERVAAAFLGGSYGRGAADPYSDLDLYVITRDAGYDDFQASRAALIRQLGEPVFLEDFGIAETLFFILSDGSEGELRTGREGQMQKMASGPYVVLLDKGRLLDGVEFAKPAAEPAEQREALRRQVYWFWHELSHFMTALARGQLWWAHGQLEALRRHCINLARLRQSFSDPDVGEESYFKIEQAVPIERLASQQTTFCGLEPGAMLQAALTTVQFYKELAPVLAEQHGIPYPAGLEHVMLVRLEALAAGLGGITKRMAGS